MSNSTGGGIGQPIRLRAEQLATNLVPAAITTAPGYGTSHEIVQFPFCSTNSSMSFSSYPPSLCPQGSLGLSPTAVEFMNNNFNRCVATGLRAIGIRKPFARVNISGQGGHFRKQSNGRVSNHTSGDAIDINNLTISFNDGSTGNFPASAVDYNGRPFEGFSRCRSNCSGRRWNMTGKALFFVHFENCLKVAIDRVKAANSPYRCSGGTLGCNDNSSHDNHMHLAPPVCPKPPNFRNI